MYQLRSFGKLLSYLAYTLWRTTVFDRTLEENNQFSSNYLSGLIDGKLIKTLRSLQFCITFKN